MNTSEDIIPTPTTNWSDDESSTADALPKPPDDIKISTYYVANKTDLKTSTYYVTPQPHQPECAIRIMLTLVTNPKNRTITNKQKLIKLLKERIATRKSNTIKAELIAVLKQRIKNKNEKPLYPKQIPFF